MEPGNSQNRQSYPGVSKLTPRRGDSGEHTLWYITGLLKEEEAKYCMGFEVAMVPPNES